MLKYLNLVAYAQRDKIVYENILKSISSVVLKKDAKLSVIVPAYGREFFSEPLFRSFLAAEKKSPVSISFTLVEHSKISLHKKVCEKLNVNHIWIPKEDNEHFNKCLAMNIGAAMVQGEEYIFHDLDCLVQSNFFEDIYKNIVDKGSQAIQTFSDRRVLYLNWDLTNKALNFEIEIDKLKEGPIDTTSDDYNGITPPANLGAPGGSIWIRKDLFLKIGGYDPNLFFGYSPEDAFFWKKVETISRMDTCTDPRVELFHMKHQATENSNPSAALLHELYLAFVDRCTQQEKEQFLKIQSNFLIEAYG